MQARIKKWHKISLIITACIIAAILGLAIVVNHYWSPILASRVKKIVLTSSDSLYNVSFSDAQLHVLRGEIDIDNIVFTPDTAVYNRRKQLHLAPNNLVELRVKRLVISHMHPFKLYFQRKLDVGMIMLKEPEIKVSYQLNHTKDTLIKDRRTTWQKISKTLQSIHIGEVRIGDIKLTYADYSAGDKPAITKLKEMSVAATDLLIDSTTQMDKSRMLYCSNIDVALANFSSRSPNGLYNYQIKNVELSTQTSRLKLEGLDIQPVRAEVFFDKTYHDQFRIHLDSLQLNHFDFQTYHKYRILRVSTLQMNSGTLAITGNPRQSPNKKDRIKSFPNIALRQLNADINIDTVKAYRVNISYTEFNQKSNKTGLITFDNTEGSITRITTNQDSLKKNSHCVARITSLFMNAGKLNFVLDLDLADPNGSFSYKGSLGPMKLQAVNRATMPLALVKFNSGKLNQADFDVNANAHTAKGRISALYNDLTVTVLKADTAHDRLKHMTIASLFANVMVLKHNNPDEADDPPRVAHVTYYRPDTVAFWGSIWKTILTGLKPSAGLDQKMQQTVKDQLAQQATKKQERKIKKAERQARRAERRRKRELKKLQEETSVVSP